MDAPFLLAAVTVPAVLLRSSSVDANRMLSVMLSDSCLLGRKRPLVREIK